MPRESGKSDKGGLALAVARLARELRREVGRELRPLGLHPGQELLLLELGEEDGLSQAELAERLGIEPATVTKMVRRLAGAKLVERRGDRRDMRVMRVHLTDAGRALLPRIEELWREADARLAGGDSGEAESLRRVLEQLRPGTGARRRASARGPTAAATGVAWRA